MFHRARRKLADLAAGALPEETVVIDDTMETDIRGAIESGRQAYLVLTGSTSLEQLAEYVYQPTRVLRSVADLTDELKSGKPSTRLDSPAYAQAPAGGRRPGRHPSQRLARLDQPPRRRR